MQAQVELQNPADWSHAPTSATLTQWVSHALELAGYSADKPELTVRLVTEDEGATLNQRYRDRSGPTNVLSFPAQLPDTVNLPLLGDLVICVPVVEAEAADQNKAIEAHLCHLVVHGVLHLLGHDHETDEEAGIMENLEVRILENMGFQDPYQTGETDR